MKTYYCTLLMLFIGICLKAQVNPIDISVSYIDDNRVKISWSNTFVNKQPVALWDNTAIGASTGVMTSTHWLKDGGEMLCADDFESDANWIIQKIHTKAGGQCGASIPSTKYGISIYSDNNGKPGEEIYSAKNIDDTGTNGNMQFVLPEPFALPQIGKYWLAIYAVFDLSTPVSITSARWNILRGNAVTGNYEINFYDPADISNDTKFADWSPVSSATYNQFPNIQSMYFSVEGLSYDIKYNVYKDNELVATAISTPYYIDESENESNHSWCVESIYENVISDRICISNDTPTNIQPYDIDIVTVTPNPTTGMIFISGKSVCKVDVYNTMGQLVASEENKQNLNLSVFPSGIYFLKIYDVDKNVVTKQILINK